MEQLGRTGSNEDRQFAPQFAAALGDVMNTAPIYGYTTPGVEAGTRDLVALPGSEGVAAAIKAKGDVLHGMAQDSSRIDEWQRKAAVPGAVNIGSQARSYLTSDEGSRFAPQGTPQYDAFSELAKTSSGPSSQSPNQLMIRHALYPVIGTLAGAAVGGAAGGATSNWDMTKMAEEALSGGLVAGMAGAGFPAIGRRFAQEHQAAALDAARATAATGKFYPPAYPPAAFRDAMRQLYFGNQAAGAVPTP